MRAAENIVKRIAPYWSARRVSILLTTIAIILWSYSTLQAELNIGFFGLIHSFPISFFIALAFLNVASILLWFSPKNHEKLLFLQWSLLIAALWLSPLLVGGTSATSALSPNAQFGHTEYLIRMGHLNFGIVYHNWPFTWIVCAAVMEIAGIEDPSLMTAITPIALQFLFLLPLYIFFRNVLGEDKRNYVWAAAWIFAIGNWMPQSFLGAQPFAILLFLTSLALLVKISPWKQRIGTAGYLLPLILVLACLPFTHLFTSLIVLSTIITLFVIKRVKTPMLPMISGIFIATWLMYATYPFFAIHLRAIVDDLFRLDIVARVVTAKYVAASEAHQAVDLTKIVFGLIFVMIAFAGGILGRKVNRDSNVTVLAIALGPLALALFFGYGYGQEIVHRIFLFELPVMAYFGVKLLNYKTTALILCILLVLLLPVHFISHYGNAEADRLSPGEIAGTYFFHDHTTHGRIIGSQTMGMIADMEKYSRHGMMWRRIYFGIGGHPVSDIISYLEEQPTDTPHYVAVTRADIDGVNFASTEPQFFQRVIQSALDNATSCNLIYINPDCSLYTHEAGE